MSDKASQRLIAYLEGDVAPSEAAEVEAQLAESPAARRRLDRYRAIAAALGSKEPELESLDLVSAVRRKAELPMGQPVRARRWPLYAGTLVAVACAALVIGTTNLGRQDEVRTKGAAPADAQRWAGIRLYRVAAAEAPRPIDGNVGSRDGVLVSYTNLGPQPFDYLMVFAVDADKQVRWLYPAWERASEDPTAIAVRKGVADLELSSLIRPSWAAGPLVVHALFTRRPLGVHEVEALLARTTGPLPLADSAEQIITLTVQP